MSPGPHLMLKTWVYDENKNAGEWIFTDVTARAHEFLFHDVYIAFNVSIADVFGLVIDKPIMKAVFGNQLSAQLCEEVQKGKIQKDEEKSCDKIEFLELYQHWDHDISINHYSGIGRYYLHGVGVVQETDVYENENLLCKKGDRIKWSISLMSVRELLHLSIHVNSEINIFKGDIGTQQCSQKSQPPRSEKITLGCFIYEILNELSWYGTPEASDKVSLSLKSQMAEVEARTASKMRRTPVTSKAFDRN